MRCEHQQHQLIHFDKTVAYQKNQLERLQKLLPKPQQESVSKDKQEPISKPEGRRLDIGKRVGFPKVPLKSNFARGLEETKELKGEE